MRKLQKKLLTVISNKADLLKFNHLIFTFVFALTSAYPAFILADNTVLHTQRYLAPIPFNTVDIHGPVNVSINGNTINQNVVELTGDTNSINHVQMRVEHSTLFLDMQPEFTAKTNSVLTINVHSSNIKNINYSGTGKISGINLQGNLNLTSSGSGSITLKGNNLDLGYLTATGSGAISIEGMRSRLLDVKDSGSGEISLNGSAVLRSIDYRGTGLLKIYWINSSDVKVYGSGSGLIYLAGIADLFDATINKNTLLNAKYLRANRVFINTAADSRAQVWAKDNLNALATDKSVIQYYYDSKFFTGYMKPPALVLRMTGIEK